MATPTIAFEDVAAELLRALRGKRSQAALSRRLKYRSNVLHTWEAGRRWPSAARFFALVRAVGIDPAAAVARFLGHAPGQAPLPELSTPRGAAALLLALRGARTTAELARTVERGRSSVSRWLSASTEPSLPELLMMIEACSLRLVDFVAELVDPLLVPSLSERWRMLEAARRLSREAPWANAVLRALELTDYVQLPRQDPRWIAARLRIDVEQVDEATDRLLQSGQVQLRDAKLVPRSVMTVDTRRDLAAEQAARVWAAHTALARMQQGGAGVFSHNLFAVSELDLARLAELQRAYFRQLRAIVAASEPAERIAIVNVQLLALDEAPGAPRGAG